MTSHSSALNMLSIMGGAFVNTSYGAGNRGDEQIISLLFLLVSDVLAGVGLRSALRSFLRSHVPLIEFSTGIEVNDSQQLEHREQQLRPIRLTLSLEGHAKASENTPFIVEVKGLKNRGQTCYANSVMQALASLEPLYIYLDSLQHNLQRNDGQQDSIALALFQTLQYINGHEVVNGKRLTRSSFLPFAQFFSSSSSGDPQRVMNIVAQHHSQFRSHNNLGMAGMQEQQDSHEFFSALMDVLSSEDQGGGSTLDTNTARHSSKGLACCNSFLHSEESTGDVSDVSVGVCNDKLGGEKFESESQSVDNSDQVTDEFEEEKKHEEQNIGDTASDRSAVVDGNNQSKDTQQIQKEKLANCTPTAKEHHIATPNAANSTPGPAIQNPFDGWSGSTIKCATCRHIRPIRSTPFLGLSLPIANVRSEFLEDFLAAEYGGFATAEQVQDVQCFSCAIRQRVQELEEEEMLLSGAISSIQRRKKGTKINQNHGNGSDIAGLVQESQQLKRKIAILEALDPDADDDKLECTDSKDTQEEVELGINNSLPPITPLRGDAYKASLLMRPPEVLCIHIQRRHYDMSCQRMVKVMRQVHFDEEINIGSFCAFGKNSFEKRHIFTTPSSDGAKIPYRLMSVIEHKGNAFGGHYQTYRRVDSNEWVLVSDESVSPRTWNDVRRCQAYMLFYVAVSRKK